MPPKGGGKVIHNSGSIDLLKRFQQNNGVLTIKQIEEITKIHIEAIELNPFVRDLDGYIEQVSTEKFDDSGFELFEDKMRITLKGRAYLEGLSNNLRKEKKESTRYWITTSIAIVAIIISIAALAISLMK